MAIPLGATWEIRTAKARRIAVEPATRHSSLPACGYDIHTSPAGGPQGRLPAAKTMKTESLSRAEASGRATRGLDPGGATREAGAAKGRPKGRPSFDGLSTPSTDRA